MCGDSESLPAVAFHYPYGTKCHSPHQYALGYSCEKASVDRSRKSSSVTAPRPGWGSSLFHTRGLAATELAFCLDHYLQPIVGDYLPVKNTIKQFIKFYISY